LWAEISPDLVRSELSLFAPADCDFVSGAISAAPIEITIVASSCNLAGAGHVLGSGCDFVLVLGHNYVRQPYRDQIFRSRDEDVLDFQGTYQPFAQLVTTKSADQRTYCG
jgi:hypothetical protein